MTKKLTNKIQLFPLTITITAAMLFTVSCAQHAAMKVSPVANGVPLNNLVHGKVVAADTNLPVAGATVFVPKTLPLTDGVLPQAEKGRPLNDLSLTTVVEQSMGCKLPTEPYSSFACTDHLGNFAISLTNAELDNIQLKFQYKEATVHAELTLNDLDSDIGTILFTENEPQSQKEKIAIVLDMSGKTSPMRSLGKSLPLPKEVEFEQQFVKMYDIDENQYDVEFMPFTSLFEDKDADQSIDIFKYKIVYLISTGDEDLSVLGKDKKTALLEFISNGGELYVTKLSVELDSHSMDDYI